MRIRTVKPEFFMHVGLYELEAETKLPIRLSFAGLWCASDREGWFAWNPRQLKAYILPYDDLDFSRVLDALLTRGFVVKHTLGIDIYGHIPSFLKHQSVNIKEKESEIAELFALQAHARVPDASGTRDSREAVAFHKEGKGREGKGTSKERELTLPGIAPSEPIGMSAFVKMVFDGWNATAAEAKLSQCVHLSDARRRFIESRGRTLFFVQNWRVALEKVKASDFCKGVNDRGWVANFDWFIKPDSVAKIIEGKYDNRNGHNKTHQRSNPRLEGVARGPTDYAAAAKARVAKQVAGAQNGTPQQAGGTGA